MILITNTLIMTIILCITYQVMPQKVTIDERDLQGMVDWFTSALTVFSNYKEKLNSSLQLVDKNLEPFHQQECQPISMKNLCSHREGSCLGVPESSDKDVTTLLEVLPQRQLENQINAQYEQLLHWIEKKEEQLVEYSRPGVYNNHTVTKFAESIVNLGPSGVDSLLDRLFRAVVPQASSRVQHTVLGSLSAHLEMNDIMSLASNVSSQQKLYNLFNKLLDVEFRGLKLMAHAHYLLAFACDVTGYMEEIKLSIYRGNRRIEKYAEAFKIALQSKSREIRLDEPKKHILGETYLEMTGLYQAMIINEYSVMEPSSCRGSCDDIDVKNFKDCYIRDEKTLTAKKADYSTDCPSPKPCYGQLKNCVRLTRPTACLLDDSTQRYEKFEDDVEEYNCANNDRRMTVNSWQEDGHTCDYCSCICEDNDDRSGSIRFISILPSLSNLIENKVIIGLRFKEHQKVIHIQIQQGELGRNGYIVPGTAEWVEVEDMEKRFRTDGGVPWTVAGEGKGFVRVTEDMTVTYGEGLKVKDGQVLTGVGFIQNGTGIELQLRGTDFCFASGKLGQYSSNVSSTECDEGQSLPTVTFSASKIAPSQSTVPFLYTRVDGGTSLAAPLAGVGLSMYSMYADESEGENLLAFKLYSLDYNFYMNNAIAWKHRKFTGGYSFWNAITPTSLFLITNVESHVYGSGWNACSKLK